MRAGHARPLRTSRKGERIWLIKPEELQEVLHYTFKNPALLRIALTHTSYANESKVATTHNERLEFLGDSVLSVVVADYLFHQSGRPRAS